MSDLISNLYGMCGPLGEEAADYIKELEESYALLFKENAELRQKVETLMQRRENS